MPGRGNWKNTAFSTTPGKGNWKNTAFSITPGKGKWKNTAFSITPRKGIGKTQHFQPHPGKGIGKTQHFQLRPERVLEKQSIFNRLGKGNCQKHSVFNHAQEKEVEKHCIWHYYGDIMWWLIFWKTTGVLSMQRNGRNKAIVLLRIHGGSHHPLLWRCDWLCFSIMGWLLCLKNNRWWQVVYCQCVVWKKWIHRGIMMGLIIYLCGVVTGLACRLIVTLGENIICKFLAKTYARKMQNHDEKVSAWDSRWTNCSNPASMSCSLPPVLPNFNVMFPYLCSWS